MQTRSQEWINSTTMNIKELFEIFDKEKTNSIVQEEVGTIMRALGVYPTEKVLNDILDEIVDDKLSGLVSYNILESKLLEILADNLYKPDPRDIILQAFRILDPSNTGHISGELIENHLRSSQYPFKQAEMDAFLAVAKDVHTGQIHYEDYVSLFPKDI